MLNFQKKNFQNHDQKNTTETILIISLYILGAIKKIKNKTNHIIDR